VSDAVGGTVVRRPFARVDVGATAVTSVVVVVAGARLLFVRLFDAGSSVLRSRVLKPYL